MSQNHFSNSDKEKSSYIKFSPQKIFTINFTTIIALINLWGGHDIYKSSQACAS